jgi:hypothetical protein
MTTRAMPFHEDWRDLEPDPGWSVAFPTHRLGTGGRVGRGQTRMVSAHRHSRGWPCTTAKGGRRACSAVVAGGTSDLRNEDLALLPFRTPSRSCGLAFGAVALDVRRKRSTLDTPREQGLHRVLDPSPVVGSMMRVKGRCLIRLWGRVTHRTSPSGRRRRRLNVAPWIGYRAMREAPAALSSPALGERRRVLVGAG